IEELAVVYSGEPASATALAEELKDLLPEGREPILTQFGPVIGTYTGLDALGIGLLRA
ncbi:MAG: DegV family protein, partial [Chloroflexi bacterium]|nr:DegV family protein [Chloroflexota bacterium]